MGGNFKTMGEEEKVALTMCGLRIKGSVCDLRIVNDGGIQFDDVISNPGQGTTNEGKEGDA